jgi:large subunit ribosomal protein L32
MANPSRKGSKSKQGMRRSHHHVDVPQIVFCECGEPTLPHRACEKCGTYRGRQVLAGKE